MSIEKDFTRIAVALERIANHLDSGHTKPVPEVVAVTPATVAPAPVAAPTLPPSAPAPTPVAAPTAPAPIESPAILPAMTIQQLNEQLVVEYNRLGQNRDPIDRIMKEKYGAVSVKEIATENYTELLAAVRAVQA